MQIIFNRNTFFVRVQQAILRQLSNTNGSSDNARPSNLELDRTREVSELIDLIKKPILDFIAQADEAAADRRNGNVPTTGSKRRRANTLVDPMTPDALVKRMRFSLPQNGGGRGGLLDTVESVLKYSVNTWDQGFLDKLTASTNAVGVVSEMLLATLNTNNHVYHVSPALTVIEKTTAHQFASLFGFDGQYAGGVTCQGGSASNFTSIVIARNALYPETKSEGCKKHDFAIFTSRDGHYSIEKAAMASGMGANNVVEVPVDSDHRMDTNALEQLIQQAKDQGKTPLYVNATAGTTVYGAYDPFRTIHAICKKHNMWMHIDGSWGGSAIFSSAQKHKLDGSHLADSLTVNPHKMLNVPMTCSFLLTPDTRRFHRANTLPAGYLFHEIGEDTQDVWDLADLTLQCGRRADSFKLALSWVYYGAVGFERLVDHAFAMAGQLATLVERNPEFDLVSPNPAPCLQVCFYYAPKGKSTEDAAANTLRTKRIVEKLLGRGFMVDYAPGPKGYLFRIVVNCQTLPGTVEGLVKALEECGREIEA
ncbi:PLP-dependent transferase [Myriangium duriaei CBS 260.36]|uniref:PLP-dependent transferase n=1 Tax=Myriangium duriaei CBS 260.36 TaxID=1168546 RepID=A0A9P4JBF3_9PEZI|nr:PLP-dependent transferase [Myriangium duriaei CBS 260.36]